MFCAAMIVAGTCMQVCGANPADYLSAWGEPRRDDATQAMVDDLGPRPQLYRYNGDMLWMSETEPVLCAPVPRLKPSWGDAE